MGMGWEVLILGLVAMLAFVWLWNRNQ